MCVGKSFERSMASTFTDIVAAKKLASIKKAYKLNTTDKDEELSPEEERKLQEKIEKDENKRQKQKEKRQDQYEEREKEREKLRSRIRAKYELGTEEEQKIGKKKNKKKGDLREKDFYKYNKAMPDTKDKNNKEVDTTKEGESLKFSSMTQELANKKSDTKKDKEDCRIS